MRRPWQWAALFIVGAVLLWLVTRRRTASATGGAVKSGPAPSRAFDVASDVPNGDVMTLDFLIDDVQANFWGTRMWTDLIRPAGRVKLSRDVTPDDWKNAFGLLSLTLDRQAERSRRFQQMQAEIADERTGAAVDQIVSTVVSVIVSLIGSPLLGGLFRLAAQQQISDLNAAIDLHVGTEALASKLRAIASNPKDIPPAARIILKQFANGWGVQDPSQLDGQKLMTAFGITDPDARDALNIESPSWHDGYGFPLIPTDDGNKGAAWPSSLFYLTRVGLLLPWQSTQLIGADYKQTVNLRARALRALVTFAAMVNPRAPGTVEGAYWYVNPVFGPILGSTLPPTDEDKHYIDGSGQWYTFDGRPGTPPKPNVYVPTGALGPIYPPPSPNVVFNPNAINSPPSTTSGEEFNNNAVSGKVAAQMPAPSLPPVPPPPSPNAVLNPAVLSPPAPAPAPVLTSDQIALLLQAFGGH